MNSRGAIELENKYNAHNYHPLPVVLSKGKGVFVWDVEGKKYFDFLSSYSAVNQGHCHPKIIAALKAQAEKLTLTSRAFYNDALGEYSKYITELFGFDKVLPMNTGAEAVETAIKITRRWGYQKKKIRKNQAKIIVCKNNFHGRTTTIISASNDPIATQDYGPYTPGIITINYNDLKDLKLTLSREGENIAGFLVEPIQGEAGIYVPDDHYIKGAYDLCKKYNTLFVADEVQTGIARTGKMLALNYSDVRPDILILGKALSGGVVPVSAVLSNDEVMEVITPGSHGSTFGGNPLSCKVAMAALEVVQQENLTKKAFDMGEIFRDEINKYIPTNPKIKMVRGKGMLNAIVVDDDQEGTLAWDMCVTLKENGLLAKPTHGNIIRLAPPLIMTKPQLMECIDIIKTTFDKFG